MKLGMFTCGYQYYPLERAFADAKRFGYDYIELWGGRPHAFAPDLASGGLAEVRALIDRYELPVEVYTPEHNAYPFNYMLGGEGQRREALDYLKQAMDQGRALGAAYTLVSVGHGGYALPRPVLWERMVRSLGELARHGEATGHTVVVETLTHYESNLCTTAGELAQALEEVNSPRLLGMCDVTPPFAAREPVCNYLDLLGNRLAHLHVVDSDGSSDSHLIPGDGALPLPELLAELCHRGYQGRCTIELVTAYQNEPSLYARWAVERLRAMLPEGWKG